MSKFHSVRFFPRLDLNCAQIASFHKLQAQQRAAYEAKEAELSCTHVFAGIVLPFLLCPSIFVRSFRFCFCCVVRIVTLSRDLDEARERCNAAENNYEQVRT